jgi:hypothetical protein
MLWIIIGIVVVVIIIGIIIVANSGGGGGGYYGGGGNNINILRGGMGNKRSSSSSLSDKRLKKNIMPLSGALNKVLTLKGVSFEWRQDEFQEMNFDTKRHIGLIAQEVEDIIPEVVDTTQEGYKSIQYANLIAILIEAIKEQQIQIKELKIRLSTIEKDNQPKNKKE